MHEDNLVILAGGVSSRMQSSLTRAPEVDRETQRRIQEGGKTMVGVDAAGRPLMEYIVGNAIAAGYRNVVLLLGVRNQALRAYIEQRKKEGDFAGVNWTFATQSIPHGRTKPLGTADALLTAMRAVPAWKSQQCTVCNGDNLYSVRALRLLRTCNAAHALIDYDRAALRFSQERIQQFAVLLKDSDGYLRRIVEKPSAQDLDAARDHTGRIGVSMNLFRFTCSAIIPFLETIPLHPQRQEKELPSAVAALLAADPHAMQTIPLSEHVPDLTDVFDVSILREFFAPPPTSS